MNQNFLKKAPYGLTRLRPLLVHHISTVSAVVPYSAAIFVLNFTHKLGVGAIYFFLDYHKSIKRTYTGSTGTNSTEKKVKNLETKGPLQEIVGTGTYRKRR